MAKKKIGAIWKGKTYEGNQMPDSITFDEGFVPTKGAFYNLQSKNDRLKGLSVSLQKGYIDQEKYDYLHGVIQKMPEAIRFEIIEVTKQ